MPKVSIIVPVYNVAEYLRRCIDSCIYQTLEDIEVIIVNDCSPDMRDEEIIRAYERDYPQKIRVYRHEKNLGLGEARNTGIKNARGEFLLFCDSDDFLDFQACEKMYSKAKENAADLVVCDYFYMRDGMLGFRNVNEGIDTAVRSYRPCVLNKVTVWVILLKKSIITDNNLFSSYRFGEDSVTVLWYLAARKIVKVDEALYYYVFRKTSLIGSLNSIHAVELLNVYYEVLQYKYFKELDVNSKITTGLLIFKRFFAYWLDIVLKFDDGNLHEFFKKILEIESCIVNFKSEILKIYGVSWESLRVIKIISFVEKNIEKEDFDESFRRFYYELDQKIMSPVLKQLKKDLFGKRVVLWGAGSYGSIFEEALRINDIDFEVTDLIVRKNQIPWNDLESSTDIVLLSSPEFTTQVKKIVGNKEVLVLQNYINEEIGKFDVTIFDCK